MDILPVFVEHLSVGYSSITHSSQELQCSSSLLKSTSNHVYKYAVVEGSPYGLLFVDA